MKLCSVLTKLLRPDEFKSIGSVNLSSCHPGLRLHCSVVKESFAPNTYLALLLRKRQEGRKALMCHTNGVIQMSYKCYSRQFILTSWSVWHNAIFTKESIVDRSEIINTGFHDPDTLGHTSGLNWWKGIFSQIPGLQTQINSLRIYGAMEIVPRCVALKNVWCMMHAWDGWGGRWRKTWIQGCFVLNLFLTWGVYMRGVGSKRKCLYV